MADRTGCTLNISGLLAQKHAHHLAKGLKAAHPYNLSGPQTLDDIAHALIEEATFDWDFDEVENGVMIPALKDALTDLRLSWSWSWNWGESYVPGIAFYNAVTGETDNFHETDREICLTLTQLKDPKRVAAAHLWGDFQNQMNFQPYASSHALAKILTLEPDLHPYADMIGQIEANALL
jgi:hypothetical protein